MCDANKTSCPFSQKLRIESPVFLPIRPLRYITFPDWFILWALGIRIHTFWEAWFSLWQSLVIVPFSIARQIDVKPETTYPSLTCTRCSHVTHPQQRSQAAVTCATLASYQEAASLLFLFPTLTDGKMATNWRRLPGTWDDIYWLTMQSHLKSLGAKRALWSNAT